MPSRIIALPLLIALAGVSCGRTPSSGRTPVDTAQVRAEVDSLMRRHFAAFQPSSLAEWGAIMDPAVFFTAATPAEVFGNRDSLLAEMEHDFAPMAGGDVTLSVQPGSSTTWVSPAGDAAATTWSLDYTVTIQDTKFPYQLRAAYLLERDSTGWQVLAAQYSRPIPYDSLFLQLATTRMAGAGRVGDAVPLTAGELARQFRSDIRDIRSAALAPGVIVTSPGRVVTGADPARRELAEWLGPVDNATEPGDGFRAALTAAGTVGWVATNLHVPVFAGPESAIAPMRALFVYRRANNRWEIVQASLSVGQRE